MQSIDDTQQPMICTTVTTDGYIKYLDTSTCKYNTYLHTTNV